IGTVLSAVGVDSGATALVFAVCAADGAGEAGCDGAGCVGGGCVCAAARHAMSVSAKKTAIKPLEDILGALIFIIVWETNSHSPISRRNSINSAGNGCWKESPLLLIGCRNCISKACRKF